MLSVRIHILRCLLVLLFCFEVAHPAFCYAPDGYNEKSTLTCFKAQSNQLDSLVLFFFGQLTSEEQTEKQTIKPSRIGIEVFSARLKFKPTQINWILPEAKENGQPPLFTLLRILRI